jgi:transcription antitermination factor NusG
MSALTNVQDFRRKPAASALDAWYIVNTRARQEKILAGELARKGIATFLPLNLVQRLYADQSAVVEVPVFPGYLFLRSSSDEATAAQQTGRVRRVDPANDSAALDAELGAIDRAIGEGVELTAHAYPRSGAKAKVTGGALRGVCGIVEDPASAKSIILCIHELRLAVSAPVKPADVQIGALHARGIDIVGSDFPPPLPSLLAPAPDAL